MRLFHVLSLGLALVAGPSLAKVPAVMTDIPPVEALVAQVMGDLGTPGMFLEAGGDEHQMQIRPSQMRQLARADLVVWVGPELTPALASALASAGRPALALLHVPGTVTRDYAGGGVNPHAWLDPDNAAAWVDAVAARLSKMDPEHAGTYRANADAARARIGRVDDEIAAELAPVVGRPFLGWHDAYGYFTGHYGLDYLGGLSEGDEAPPGAARLAEVRRLAQAGGIVCAFAEAQHDPGLLAQLGVKLGDALDPVGSMQPAGPGAWEAVMRGLAGKLVACLSP